MDPNENLRQLRALLAGLSHCPIDPIDVASACELFEALDEWIGRGGFLPDDWARGRASEQRSEQPEPEAAGPRVSTGVTVTWERVCDLLCCAWEGGSSYWVECYGTTAPTAAADRERVRQSYENALYAGGVCLMRETDSGELEPRPLELNRESLARGLQVMADRYPRHFADVMAEGDDATTGDVYLQCCLLGSVVYG